jgi:hypothetical protein
MAELRIGRGPKPREPDALDKLKLEGIKCTKIIRIGQEDAKIKERIIVDNRKDIQEVVRIYEGIGDDV